MKKVVRIYILVMIFLCCAVIGAFGLITVSEKTSAVTFGTKTDKIKLDTDSFGTELESIVDSISSFLPFRE